MYTDEPIRSFVVEVELTSNVDGGILQEAVDDVLARAPYFADALVERDGTFYYAKCWRMQYERKLQTTGYVA